MVLYLTVWRQIIKQIYAHVVIRIMLKGCLMKVDFIFSFVSRAEICLRFFKQNIQCGKEW